MDDAGWFDDDFGEFEYQQERKIVCEYPYQHVFEKKIYVHVEYDECKICGYNPDLDGNKEQYRECHEEYMKWKKDREEGNYGTKGCSGSS